MFPDTIAIFYVIENNLWYECLKGWILSGMFLDYRTDHGGHPVDMRLFFFCFPFF